MPATYDTVKTNSMEATWKSLQHEPPEETILLVHGPTGLDLAMYVEGHWYFKYGDDWSSTNLELWVFNTPTHWALPPKTGPLLQVAIE